MHRRTSVGATDPSLFLGGAPAAPAAVYLRVVVERGLDAGAQADGLTYASPTPDVEVGERVWVPLGKNDRPAGGVVVAKGGPELLEGLAASRVKPILRATGVRLPRVLSELAGWLAAYYVCPFGMVLSTMLPAAVKQQTGRREQVFILGVADPGKRAEATAPDNPPQTTTAASEAKPAAAAALTPPAALTQPAALTPSAPLTSASSAAPPPRLSPKARALLRRLNELEAGAFPAPVQLLADRLELSSPRPLLRLAGAGLLRAESRQVVAARAVRSPRLRQAAAPPTLTQDQARVVRDIGAGLGRFGVHLLRGITGSGKTEVYIRLIQQVLEAGRTAIVLVPEIALTPQTSERFRDRFDTVAVLHSGLTAAQRHAEWSRAARGEARVVVGARSAVFAPLPDLGLIVVDEEHDHSYKQDQLPRYHARDVAIKRGQIEGCPVVLGSATPSLESWANARGGHAKFGLHELPARAGVGRLPRVEILDLMEERRLMRAHAARLAADAGGGPRSRPGLVGPTLLSALKQTLSAGGQAIILLNRRGYSSYLCCSNQNCGWLLTCDQCDAAMVLHMDRAVPAGKLVKCHHCLAEQVIPRRCPVCENTIIWLGGGTQRIEEELIDALADSHGLVENQTLKRVDSDSMRRASDYFDALSRFGAGEIRVLVGTQMIAKGLDYPNVRLVGVVNADTALALPDFRAAERTFQLISQVAGRAGRGAEPGRVILQTVQPDHPVIQLAAAHDYRTFADQELELRRESRLPPVTRMARLVTRDRKLEKAKGRAEELARYFGGSAAGSRELLIRGPMPCPIARIAGYWRFAVELTSPTAGALQRVLTAARNAGLLKSDAATAVDVDPVAMM